MYLKSYQLHDGHWTPECPDTLTFDSIRRTALKQYPTIPILIPLFPYLTPCARSQTPGARLQDAPTYCPTRRIYQTPSSSIWPLRTNLIYLTNLSLPAINRRHLFSSFHMHHLSNKTSSTSILHNSIAPRALGPMLYKHSPHGARACAYAW